jgi:hypothetical protein
MDNNIRRTNGIKTQIIKIKPNIPPAVTIEIKVK